MRCKLPLTRLARSGSADYRSSRSGSPEPLPPPRPKLLHSPSLPFIKSIP